VRALPRITGTSTTRNERPGTSPKVAGPKQARHASPMYARRAQPTSA
jgi:hypothetical protein